MSIRSNAAKLIVECLENEGVQFVFGIPGQENIHFIAAMQGSRIRFVLARHEQAASLMADIYGSPNNNNLLQTISNPLPNTVATSQI
jgi:acetolactate synthase-1/2/3 large subunit